MNINIGGVDRLVLYAVRYLSWKLQIHDLVRSFPIPFAELIYRLIKKFNRNKINFANTIFPDKYTDADPYKYILVDPSSIEYTSSASRCRGWVVTTELKSQEFMNRTIPRAIQQRFGEGVAWENTTLADKNDRSNLVEQTKPIERLYYKIKENGYQSQQQLLEEDPETTWGGCNDAMHPLANEIAVDIGSDGEVLWNMCGQHRLAIAKVLQIDQIPVQIMRRHADWQNIRDEVKEKNRAEVESYRTHPDLTDLIESNE